MNKDAVSGIWPNFFAAETEWERFSGPEHSDSIERNYLLSSAVYFFGNISMETDEILRWSFREQRKRLLA